MSEKITAILVDDEERARNVLFSLLSRHCPDIEVVDQCANVPSAVESIKKHKPDVLFLDIEMPLYAGYEIVSFFDEIEFEIIFVTAYDKYAIKAFDISAVDYLLKPIEIERLVSSVKRLEKNISIEKRSGAYKALGENLKSPPISKLVVRHQGMQKILDTKDIIAIEAQEAYSCIHTNAGKYLMSKNLKHYENSLEHNINFLRSHKSWIVNLNKLDGYSKSKLQINLESNLTAKLSKYKKAEFEKLIS